MNVYDFIESADSALFCCFSELGQGYVVFLSLVVGFGFVGVECGVVT